MAQVLGIVGSPRYGGNTSIMIAAALEAAKATGVKTKQIELAELSIKPCESCHKCTELGYCVINDDLHIVVEAIEKSQGIIFGAPGYFGSIPTIMKCVIDRIGRFMSFKGKSGGALTVGRRSGVSNTLQELHFLMYVKEMIIPGTPAWPTGFALHPGDILSDTDAMNSARQVGARVGLLSQLLTKHPVPWIFEEDAEAFGDDWRKKL